MTWKKLLKSKEGSFFFIQIRSDSKSVFSQSCPVTLWAYRKRVATARQLRGECSTTQDKGRSSVRKKRLYGGMTGCLIGHGPIKRWCPDLMYCCEMTCETNYMQQLWFINNPVAQQVSGIIVPIFRIAGPYITAYGFQHLMCWLESWKAGRPSGSPRFQPAH